MNFSSWFSHRINLRRGVPASTLTGVVIAIAGVALALMVMEISLAVASGFKHEIEKRVLGFDSSISILPPYDYYTATSAKGLSLDDSLRRALAKADPALRPVEKFVSHAILKTDSDYIAVECRAFGPGHDYTFERGILEEGTLPGLTQPCDTQAVAISRTMARKLRLAPSDRAFLYFFEDNEPRARRVRVEGIYQSNFGEYDDAVIYTTLPLLQGVARADSTYCTSLAIENIPLSDITPLTDHLQASLLEAYSRRDLPAVYPVTNVFHSGAVFFNWLDLLDTNVIVIFILMICVAAFTLISSLFIIILDRVPTIGVLRALGAGRAQVSRIFVLLTLRLVGAGMIIGNILALGLMLLQNHFHFLRLDPQMYYLAYVPFEINWLTILLLNAGVALGAWLILILPARLASRIDPASTMRYE